MRTMYSGRYAARKFFRRTFKIFLITFLISLVFLWMSGIRELVDNITVNTLEYLVTDIINTSVYDCMKECNFTFDSLAVINRDDSGNVVSVNIEPYAANILKSKIASVINKRVNEIDDDDIEITLGMIVGYCSLGSWGPEIPLAVSPNSNVEIDFANSFVSCGINQVQDNMTIEVDVAVSALMPFLRCESNIHSSVIVAQTVIVGDVPNTYINIGERKNDR